MCVSKSPLASARDHQDLTFGGQIPHHAAAIDIQRHRPAGNVKEEIVALRAGCAIPSTGATVAGSEAAFISETQQRVLTRLRPQKYVPAAATVATGGSAARYKFFAAQPGRPAPAASGSHEYFSGVQELAHENVFTKRTAADTGYRIRPCRQL